MEPITLGIAALIGYSLLKKKKGKKDGTDSAGTGGGTTESYKPDAPGAPYLRIDDVKPLLNRLKFSASADGKSVEKIVHKIKDLEPKSIKLGNHFLLIQTDPTVRPGEKHPDAVMLVMKDKNNKTIIAKRVLVEDDNIIDIV